MIKSHETRQINRLQKRAFILIDMLAAGQLHNCLQSISVLCCSDLHLYQSRLPITALSLYFIYFLFSIVFIHIRFLYHSQSFIFQNNLPMRRGFSDFSFAFMKRLIRHKGLSGHFLRSDMRTDPWSSACFGSVFCLRLSAMQARKKKSVTAEWQP